MSPRRSWSRILVVLGSIALLGGVLDPLEGSVIILLGSALILAGVLLDKAPRRVLRYWLLVFVLIAAGVGALFGLSAVGGMGGTSGRSFWWGLILLPYPIGWLMGMAGVVHRAVEFFRLRRPRAPAC